MVALKICFSETAGLLPAKYYLSLHAGEPKWDVRENLFMRQKYLEKMNSIKKDFAEEEGYQVTMGFKPGDNVIYIQWYHI